MSKATRESARRERARQLFKRIMKHLSEAPFSTDPYETGVKKCIDEIANELDKEAKLARMS